jgi:hypothetical protein
MYACMQAEAGSKDKEMKLLLDASHLMLGQAACRMKQLPVHSVPLGEKLLSFWVCARAFVTLWREFGGCCPQTAASQVLL